MREPQRGAEELTPGGGDDVDDPALEGLATSTAARLRLYGWRAAGSGTSQQPTAPSAYAAATSRTTAARSATVAARIVKVAAGVMTGARFLGGPR